jgi:hypothetical protein
MEYLLYLPMKLTDCLLVELALLLIGLTSSCKIKSGFTTRLLNNRLLGCEVGTSDFDAQMSGIKIQKGNEILRPIYKKPFSEILSGCFRLGFLVHKSTH